MIDQEYVEPASDLFANSETRGLLDAQRVAVQSAFGSKIIEPQIGDVWLSGVHWISGTEEALTAMLVVLRSFSEAWSARPLFDVAPVSEDERLASEWSLILSPSQSGLGLPLVLHVDVQCTTTSSMLHRRVGALSDLARLDLEALIRAHASGDCATVELRVGRTGRVSIRFHPEWEEFSRELVAISQAFAAPLARERMKQGLSGVPYSEESSDEAVLVVASGAVRERPRSRERCNWQYQSSPPFVYCLEKLDEKHPSRLGEAIALFYSRRAAPSIVGTAVSAPLDIEGFERLAPFLDAALERLMSATTTEIVKVLLFQVTGLTPAFQDLKIIVESVRQAKRKVVLAEGAKPMRLAARRQKYDDT